MAMVQCRECGSSVSSAAPTCPHCGVPDPSGRTTRHGSCLGCGREIGVTSTDPCPHCGLDDPLTPFRSPATEEQENNQPKIIALIGSALLALGVFLPILSVPFAGSQNYFQNGRGDGVVVLLLALIAAALTVTDRVRHVWIPGLISGGVVTFTFFNLMGRLESVRRQMEVELAGNPFQGLGEAAMQSVQMQWGWVVLALGALALLTAGWMARE